MLRLSLRPVRLRRQDTSVFIGSIWRPPFVLSRDAFFYHHGQRSARGNIIIDTTKNLPPWNRFRDLCLSDHRYPDRIVRSVL
eukprot:8510011-Pyramimonas_sp.AAC.1